MPATIKRWNISSISNFEGDLEKRPIIVYVESWRRQFYFSNFNPRALHGAQLKSHLIQLVAHGTGLFPKNGDRVVCLIECGESIGMLLSSGSMGFVQRPVGVTVGLGDPPSRNARSASECNDRQPISLCFGAFTSVCLIVVVLLSTCYAVYNCAYTNNNSYYIFVLIRCVLIISGFLLIPTMPGFFSRNAISTSMPRLA